MFALTITYDRSRPAKSLIAYRISLMEIDDGGALAPFRQLGPTLDGIVKYGGRFSTLAAAVAEIEAFVDVPRYAVVRQSYGGEYYYAIQGAYVKGGYDAKTGAVTYVLTRKTEQGVYRAHEVM